MKWSKFSQKEPIDRTTVLVEYFSGDYERRQYRIEDNEWWKRYINAYLDTEEPSFTVEDIKLAYNTGWSRGYNHNYDEADRYLKQQYNIDIN